MVTDPKQFRQQLKPNWCPGCGNFSLLQALPLAWSELGLLPHQVATITGIGCSGRMAGYMHTYGFHALHGRAVPLAQGVKLANRDLTVIAAGGDGDGLGIGLNHLIHGIRRNVDITYVIVDNHIYGLTKGQTSPTSPAGFVSKTSPAGSIDAAIPPLAMALSAGIGFLAQGFTGDVQQLKELIKAGIKHNGFSLIIVYTPCVTYNNRYTYRWYREQLLNLDEMADYDSGDRLQAIKMVVERQELVRGIVFQKARASYQDLLPNQDNAPPAKQELTPREEVLKKLMQPFA